LRGRQIRTQYEEIVLDCPEEACQLRIIQLDSRQTENRVQFIDITIGADASVRFADPAAIDK
jgi:hypothetical protein